MAQTLNDFNDKENAFKIESAIEFVINHGKVQISIFINLFKQIMTFLENFN